jgi:hypothetical protein
LETNCRYYHKGDEKLAKGAFVRSFHLFSQACHQVVEANHGYFRPVESYEEEKEERNIRRLKYCMLGQQ